MQNKTAFVHHFDHSSFQASSVFVLSSVEIGPAYVAVPAEATVVYIPFRLGESDCYALLVWVDGGFLGWHCGERSGNIVKFKCESDAVRLADTRNAAWAACRSVEEVA